MAPQAVIKHFEYDRIESIQCISTNCRLQSIVQLFELSKLEN